MNSLAANCGVTPEEIWEHPDNRSLRERRPDPSLLQAGDIIALPEASSSVDNIRAGSTHRFSGSAPHVRLHLKLLGEVWNETTTKGQRDVDETGARSRAPDAVEPPPTVPLANVAYRLEAGGRVIEGSTDADGILDEPIPAWVMVAKLVVEPGTEHERKLEVRVGYLDPAEERSGLVQRLTNLGFACKIDEEPAMMIAAYQKSRGLHISGEFDEATCRRILDDSGG